LNSYIASGENGIFQDALVIVTAAAPSTAKDEPGILNAAIASTTHTKRMAPNGLFLVGFFVRVSAYFHGRALGGGLSRNGGNFRGGERQDAD